MDRNLYTPDHDAFRDSVRKFVEREVAPHLRTWEEQRLVDRRLWQAAARQGIVGLAVPEEYGGGGESDIRFRAVVMEELAAIGAASVQLGFSLTEDIALPYFLELTDEEQKRRWLPGLAAGDLITAVAMTEPDAGSDLQGMRTSAVRDGGHWLLNGAKTFITNGTQADLVVVAARTDPSAGSRGISLFVVERDTPGFSRGRKLEKIGLHGQDTAELFFHDARVPAENLLGEPGHGLRSLIQCLPRERLAIAMGAQAAAEAAFGWTLEYVRDRRAFGRPIAAFQNTAFTLAELRTALDVSQAFIDRAMLAANDGRLTVEDAAKAKWWATELQQRVTDRGLQLHGGYGYMAEYPIARAFLDGRVQSIYGGTNEIMKEIISRQLIQPG
ncbi:acyl-CoA dehydrogenase family protein [Streptomyces leeuwenhoekii]|uniref:Acyl-[acyl-carrier-protein] dehydrogenase MbtN n=1 Tax=Streptomyces leeuwenhoekii TaxID=1437453 RepID=A0A0F7VYL5_STRLW|nr:acyl-CoA dehydrogenase family protein [Streptomyces leeuwenhoekii]CQR65579.1 Acyl-CoA dehydrogenase [Streptomyces leeuwenhoekii]